MPLTASSNSRPVIAAAVAQHVDDAAALRQTRSVLVRAPHIDLHALTRADERLAAHLDGVAVAGEAGVQATQAALESPGLGALFVSTVLAFERKDAAQIKRLMDLLETLPAARPALASALGWLSPPLLRGLAAPLLASPSPAARWLGIAVCAQHRVDPGAALPAAIEDAAPSLRARALQAAGELGRIDLLSSCLAHLTDEAPECAAAAARAAALLGDRATSLDALQSIALQPGPCQTQALALALSLMDAANCRSLVKRLAAHDGFTRMLIRAAGWTGDVQVIPWLLKHMENDKHARLAGEAFTFIVGADLIQEQLEREAPTRPADGPNEDPDDGNVELDDDESLPWPDVHKLSLWWQENSARFVPGGRYFAGQPPSAAHCLLVLRQRTQRLRSTAATHLLLLQPGQPLFNVAAPAWRQRRQLLQMKA